MDGVAYGMIVHDMLSLGFLKAQCGIDGLLLEIRGWRLSGSFTKKGRGRLLLITDPNFGYIYCVSDMDAGSEPVHHEYDCHTPRDEDQQEYAILHYPAFQPYAVVVRVCGLRHDEDVGDYWHAHYECRVVMNIVDPKEITLYPAVVDAEVVERSFWCID